MANSEEIAESVIEEVTKNENARKNLIALQHNETQKEREGTADFDFEAMLVSRYTVSKLKMFDVYEEQISTIKSVLETGKAKEKEEALARPRKTTRPRSCSGCWRRASAPRRRTRTGRRRSSWRHRAGTWTS